MLNLTKTQKICIQYGFLLLLICMTVYLVSTTLDITLIPMIMKLVNKKFIFIGFLIMVLYIILECTIINILIKTIQKTKVINRRKCKKALRGREYHGAPRALRLFI